MMRQRFNGFVTMIIMVITIESIARLLLFLPFRMMDFMLGRIFLHKSLSSGFKEE